ncbi:beta-lactamase (plasmid) [Rhizobium sp. Pop5]|uniref:class C beta-lactamase n=1 Tax=Rhizobium sp. Pop5 TaxID=1223565 RepID=UPI000283CCC1|nr:class C beta-lactamase [Rhizobium sp. Pop5]EJZ18438.1 beta-lactamase/D-alanine carboxypeptidase [Rhizobium sp. Pop5]UVD60312.1 beta-lactamase [Rhizobium sp. Pop5]
MNKCWYLVALFISALSSNASIARADEFGEKAQTSFEPLVKEYDIPGLVVGVTRNGKHEFYALGLASRADNRPVTPDTLFELGSISKIFNVTLAALAEERGNLSLGDTVARHICADACSIGDKLTLLDLATHHSGGLPLQVPDGVSNINGLVNWLKDWHPPQPGTRSYSNVSIGMLGYISGKATGSDYKQVAQDVLFPAFGLRHTWIDVPKSELNQYAFGYDRKTNAPIRVNPGVLDAEAYGVKSSVRDMLKVLDVELGHGNASDELRKAVERTQEGHYKTAFFTQDMIWEQYPWPADLQTMVSGNGYDFIMKPQPIEKISPSLPPQKDVILNKTGSTNGFGGYIAIVPSEDIGVVVLANKNYPNEARVKATYSLIKALLSRE